jgi:luciferase family oxidoreductase group 1
LHQDVTVSPPAVSPLAVPLSVLELSPVASGGTPRDALANTTELAKHVERLGYRRFWLAEHHNMPGIASSAPAVLIGHVAAATTTLRVGSGGVMLPNHPPLVVAEQFGMLEALHPGRIDLGIGRAPGTDPVTASALRRSAEPLSADDFPQQLGELLAFFDGTWPEGHPYQAITAVPGLGYRPPVWLLGSSGYSAQVAGLLGMPFAFAHHFSSVNTLPALALYRDTFRPSAELSEPYSMIAASVLAADSDEHARYLAGPGGLSFLRLRSGRPGRFPSPEEAASYPYTPQERAFVDDRLNSQIIGGPESVRRQIDELLAATGVNELMITTMTYDTSDRWHSFDLVAQVCGLLPEPSELSPVELS